MQDGIPDTVYRFDEFELDTHRRVLIRDGETVALNSKSLDLLLYLVGNHGSVVGKDELLENVWPDQFVEENNLTVQISALRKALGERKKENNYIVTVPGRGYKFVADVSVDEDTEITIENRTVERITVDEAAPAPSRLLGDGKRGRTFTYIAAAIILASIAVWLIVGRSSVNAAPIESIAVMPFFVEGGDAETEYLSDGITETLINSLSQLQKLTVKARGSVFHYKGKEIEPAAVGSELGVQAVLLGRIMNRGENIEIKIELVDARTGNQVWGEQYIRRSSDLATLQTQIARDVSDKLRQKLAKGGSLARGETANAEAYKLYLKGRYLWNKRKQEEHVKAVALFEQAIALDPNFALAYAGLGDVYTVDSYHSGTEAERNTRARAAARKALELEPSLAEAYTILAKTDWNEFDRSEAEENFRRALDLNPNYASARQWHAEFLIQDGLTESALAEIDRAIELDPLSLAINDTALYLYCMAHQYDRAIGQAAKTLELDSNWRSAYLSRGITYEYMGDYQAAIADYLRANELSNKSEAEKQKIRNEYDEIRRALEKDGPQGYWQKQLDLQKKDPEPFQNDDYYFAIIYANLGDRENAIAWLTTSIDKNQEDSHLLKIEPAFDTIRHDSRFPPLCRRIGIECGE